MKTFSAFCWLSILLLGGVPMIAVPAFAQTPLDDDLLLNSTSSGDIVQESRARTSLVVDGINVSLTAKFFVNNAYKCGASGSYSFLLVEPATEEEQEDPDDAELGLWVLLRSGGGGYFDSSDQSYWFENVEGVQNVKSCPEVISPRPAWCGGVRQNQQESSNALLKILLSHIQNDGNATVVENRILSHQWRFLIPSLCDHDSFLGLSHEYPHNPYVQDATVDGLVATLSAIGYATQEEEAKIVLHGTSAGSFGVYAVAYAMGKEGRPVEGVLADSGLVTTHFREGLVDKDCRQVQDDDGLDMQALDAKNGQFWWNSSWFVESTLRDGTFTTPFFDLYSDNDPGCCGDTEQHLPINSTVEENCQYVHQPLLDALPPNETLFVSRMVKRAGHVFSDRPGVWVDWIEEWLVAVLNQ